MQAALTITAWFRLSSCGECRKMKQLVQDKDGHRVEEVTQEQYEHQLAVGCQQAKYERLKSQVAAALNTDQKVSAILDYLGVKE